MNTDTARRTFGAFTALPVVVFCVLILAVARDNKADVPPPSVTVDAPAVASGAVTGATIAARSVDSGTSEYTFPDCGDGPMPCATYDNGAWWVATPSTSGLAHLWPATLIRTTGPDTGGKVWHTVSVAGYTASGDDTSAGA